MTLLCMEVIRLQLLGRCSHLMVYNAICTIPKNSYTLRSNTYTSRCPPAVIVVLKYEIDLVLQHAPGCDEGGRRGWQPPHVSLLRHIRVHGRPHVHLRGHAVRLLGTDPCFTIPALWHECLLKSLIESTELPHGIRTISCCRNRCSTLEAVLCSSLVVMQPVWCMK